MSHTWEEVEVSSKQQGNLCKSKPSWLLYWIEVTFKDQRSGAFYKNSEALLPQVMCWKKKPKAFCKFLPEAVICIPWAVETKNMPEKKYHVKIRKNSCVFVVSNLLIYQLYAFSFYFSDIRQLCCISKVAFTNKLLWSTIYYIHWG